MDGKSIARVLPPLVILVIALGMSLEGAHASVTSRMPYGESQPFNGISSPNAYYYDGVTYVAWQGANLDIYAASYTNATWSAPAFVAHNPLSSIPDDHGTPAIIVDNSGYIDIMYGSHASVQKYARSTNPEDISDWTAMPDPLPSNRGAACPNLLKDSTGNLHLIFRTNRVGDPTSTDLVAGIVTSTDGGATWSSPQDLINVYTDNTNDRACIFSGEAEYEAATNRIHLAWGRYNANYEHYVNVYYAYLNLNDNKMYSIAGTNLGTTIDQTEADLHCKIIDSGILVASNARVRVDSSSNPYIIYVASTGRNWGWKYNFTRWTGASWSAPTIITTSIGIDSTVGSEFFVHSSTNIEAYLVANTVSSRGGDIEQWSWDGSTWTKVSTILTHSQYGLDFPTEVVNGVDLKIVFCEVNIGAGQYTVSNLRIFAYDGSQLVVKRRS